MPSKHQKYPSQSTDGSFLEVMDHAEDQAPIAVEPASLAPLEDDKRTERKLVWKLDLSVLPFATVLYLFSSLDRGNIGNARLGGLEEDLGLVGNEFYNALSIFFVGYVMFQIPSNIGLKIFTPSLWFGFAALAWGACSTSMAATRNYAGLMATRTFLGISESFMAPCLPVYLSFWYMPNELGSRNAIFYAASTVAGAFGGILAWAIIGHLEGVLGLASWRWLFIIEGLPTVLLGFLCLLFLPNYPKTAGRHFLTPTEKHLAIERVQSVHNSDDDTFSKPQLLACLQDWNTWRYMVIYIGIVSCVSSYSIFLPTIVHAMGFQSLQAQLLTIPPYVVGCLAVVAAARYSDRVMQRSNVIALTLSAAILGYVFLLIGEYQPLQYTGAILVPCGVFPSVPLAIAWLSNNTVGHTKRGVTLAIANSAGQAVSIVGTQIYRAEDAPDYRLGHGISLCFVVLSLCFTVFQRRKLASENRRREREYGRPEDVKVNEEQSGYLYDRHPAFRYVL
ncbi:major facilitator superfamily transporter [Syncephalastrum racemosum]|uniref:Major facilitator superfamily transporter n=1 Tax=Syncephalastrum racemosum TaxID=13706 RepID=A0A1X2HDJ5_SYNRA|nr:major facilitator superfamily transporter [Syncephalastrum racemosum]